MAERRWQGTLERIYVEACAPESIAGFRHSGFGVLLRDLELSTLVAVADGPTDRFAVDLDSVAGLEADDAGVRFVMERLGILVVITRRPAIAALAAARGGLGLAQVFAFDSTGLRRAHETDRPEPGVGTVVSPGPVLSHLTREDLASLPRPIVADGLIDGAERALGILRLADSVVVDLETAREVLSAPAAVRQEH